MSHEDFKFRTASTISGGHKDWRANGFIPEHLDPSARFINSVTGREDVDLKCLESIHYG